MVACMRWSIALAGGLAVAVASLSKPHAAPQVPSASASVTWTLAGWPARPQPGTPFTFALVALNPATTPVTCTFPSTLVGHLDADGRRWELIAEIVEKELERRTTLAPGSFQQRQYRVTIPAAARGAGRLQWQWADLPELGLALLETAARPQDKESGWPRWLRDADPEAAGTTLEPGRFFKEHFFAYEPFYFIAGTESPNAKFQISFKYRVLNEEGPLAARLPLLQGLHLAYTQTSLWDWNSESKPFFDSSYKPEVLWSWDDLLPAHGPNHWVRFDLQGGFQHESNGKGGLDSRSLNIAYLRPSLTLGPPDAIQLKIQPRFWAYVGGLEENPDLPDYRGYADLRLVLGWPRGLQVAALGRLGDDANRGSLQVDLTYPMMRVLTGSLSLYFHAQYFTGYGESLLDYRGRSEMFRVGLSLYR